MNAVRLEDLHWVAGILEGEGCFRSKTTSLRKDGNSRYHYPAVEVNMADEDVIRRLQTIMGVGNVHGPYGKHPAHPDWKPMWRWSVQKKHDAEEVMTLVYPIMGSRRRQKIEDILGLVPA